MRKLSLILPCLFLVAITAVAQKTPVKHPAGTEPEAEESRSYTAGRFSLEIDGVLISGVEPIEGIDELAKQARYRPGNNKTTRIKITREWSNDTTFREWYKTVIDGKVERKSISVIFHNDAGEEAGRLNFHECWPTDYTEPDENARSSGHATESITLVYETFDYKK
jgi:phage tail-like protein